jgi:hypothetical protein
MNLALVLQVWLLLGQWKWPVSATEIDDEIGDYLEERIDIDRMILSFSELSNANQQQERIYPTYPQYVIHFALNGPSLHHLLPHLDSKINRINSRVWVIPTREVNLEFFSTELEFLLPLLPQRSRTRGKKVVILVDILSSHSFIRPSNILLVISILSSDLFARTSNWLGCGWYDHYSSSRVRSHRFSDLWSLGSRW